MSNYTMSPVVNGEKKQMIVKVGDTSPIGLVADYDGSVVPNGWQQVENVLWTNVAPTSEFASQEITLSENISNYDFYEIQYSLSTSSTTMLSAGKIPVANSCYMLSNSNFMIRRTTNIPNTNKLRINDAILNGTYGTSGSSANGSLIPIKVLGYKKQIKKIAPVTPANGNIENAYGTSQENTYSQEYINGAINDQSSNIVTVPYTDFTIATNHVINTLNIKYNKATGFCLLSFRITTKDNDPQYNTYNAWQNQFTIPTKYAPPSLVFNVVYNGSGSAGVVRVQPSSDSTNKGKVDVYGHASYFLTEGSICWYTNAGIE